MSKNHTKISKYVVLLLAQNAGFQLLIAFYKNIPAGIGTVSRYITSVQRI